MASPAAIFDPVWVLSFEWLYELDALLERHSDLYIRPDTATMTVIELWELYVTLRARP